MKKILLIQFRINKSSKEGEFKSIKSIVKNRFNLYSIDAIEQNLKDISLGDYDALILGGSGELYFDGGKEQTDFSRTNTQEVVENIRPIFDFVFKNNLPTFGICFGHQLMGNYMGSKVKNDKRQSKTGSFEISIKNENPLTKDLPNTFFAQYGHKDSLTSTPNNSKVILSGDSCHYAGISYTDKIFSVQFHPELSDLDIKERIKNHPEYLPPDVLIDDLIKPSPFATKILENFLDLI